MVDLSVYESGEGGELIKTGTDLVTTDSLFNQVYLSWFGGMMTDYDEDVEDFPVGEERVNYWQDLLFFPDEEDQRMNGRLEYVLSKTSLTSSGLFEILSVAEHDIHFLEELANVSVDVELVGPDKVSITATIIEKENLNESSFVFLWDATQQELIEKRVI